jgi:hypothetical protein
VGLSPKLPDWFVEAAKRPKRPLTPRQLAAAKEYDRQYEQWLQSCAQEFLWSTTGPRHARRLLAQAIKADEGMRKGWRGRPHKVNLFVLQLAAEIQRRNPSFNRRKALLAAGVPKGRLRPYEDKLRGRTLAQYVESIPVKAGFIDC